MKKAKRGLAFLLVILLLCSGFAVGAGAAPSGDWEYTVADGKATITDYMGSDEAVEIPDNLDGYPVTGIGDYVFYNCASIQSVSFPSSIVSIGSGAFMHCKNLASVTIPRSITSIEHAAFSACASLTSIEVDKDNPNYSSQNGMLLNKNKTLLMQYPGGGAANCTIPASVTHMEEGAFYRCVTLESVILPNGIAKIESSAFSGCTALINVSIPGSMRTIGQGAFNNCISLTEIVIPEGVDMIGYGAFFGCENLTSVTIPKSVYLFADDIFQNCPNLVAKVVKNSFAERYCNNNNIKYELTEESYFTLWGKTTNWEKSFWNWILCIVFFGWIWMAF